MMIEKALLIEKKSKAKKKLPKKGGFTASDRKKKRSKKSVKTYKIYIFKVLKQVHLDIRILSKAMGIIVTHIVITLIGHFQIDSY